MSVQEYLDKHLLSRKIEDAVNAAVRAKASDPVLFIVPIPLTTSPSPLLGFVLSFDFIVASVRSAVQSHAEGRPSRHHQDQSAADLGQPRDPHRGSRPLHQQGHVSRLGSQRCVRWNVREPSSSSFVIQSCSQIF